MSGRQGGKLKPLKQAKKDDKVVTDVSFTSFLLCFF